MDELDYQQLGLSEEDYKRKEQEYKEDLRSTIRDARGDILYHIKNTFGLPVNQRHLRMMSWYYLSQPYEDRDRLDKFKPTPLATSPQDAYHIQHLTHAFFLALDKPGLKDPCCSTDVQLAKNWALVEKDELTRLENQSAFFSQLQTLIPGVSTTEKRLTLQDLDERLQRIEMLLEKLLCK